MLEGLQKVIGNNILWNSLKIKGREGARPIDLTLLCIEACPSQREYPESFSTSGFPNTVGCNVNIKELTE